MPEFDATTASDSLRIILADDTSRARESLRAVMNERDEALADAARLRESVRRVFRDRRESDKVLAECLAVMPELAHTASVEHGRLAC